jgi:cytochrome P450
MPPGPSGHPLFGSLPELTEDWLGVIGQAVRRYGPVVRFRMPWPLRAIIVVADPRHAEYMFVSGAENFCKPVIQRMVAPVLGDGLLLAEGDRWLQRRRLLNPAFHRHRVAAYAEEMSKAAAGMVAAWPESGERDIYVDAADLALRVAADTMFGADLGARSHDVRRALGVAVAAFNTYFTARVPLPPFVPTRSARRLRRAARELRALVSELVARRGEALAGGGAPDRNDLLDVLHRARTADGTPLTATELTNEAVTLFLAGAETTAVALAWTLYLLARYPDAAARVRAEVDALGASAVPAEAMAALPFTNAVVRESLRLYPPAWIVGREAIRDCAVDGGFSIPRGTQVLTCTYWMQRDPAHFRAPDAFSPERWTDPAAARCPRFAYFPFGAGQRMCIGDTFAITELVIAVATAVRAADFEPADPPPIPQPGFTLRPRDGIRLRVRRRVPERAGMMARPAEIVS